LALFLATNTNKRSGIFPGYTAEFWEDAACREPVDVEWS
jgi:hypothetical protein